MIKIKWRFSYQAIKSIIWSVRGATSRVSGRVQNFDGFRLICMYLWENQRNLNKNPTCILLVALRLCCSIVIACEVLFKLWICVLLAFLGVSVTVAATCRDDLRAASRLDIRNSETPKLRNRESGFFSTAHWHFEIFGLRVPPFPCT